MHKKCRRTACATPFCTHYHRDTGEYYCNKCAITINEYSNEGPLLFLIGTEPNSTEEEINKARQKLREVR